VQASSNHFIPIISIPYTYQVEKSRLRETTVSIISRSRAVTGTVRLSSGLDPDDGVDVAGTGRGRGASTEAGAVNVAPVTPLITDVLDTRAALVDEELGGPGEERSKSL
jgi:hypothetical protein